MNSTSPVGAREHYQRLLSRHYTWMIGQAYEEKVAHEKDVIQGVLTRSTVSPGGAAVDLGSGPGYQAVALAALGFSPVVAIDHSAELLSELRRGTKRYPALDIREQELCELKKSDLPLDLRVATCMGDTVTHLQSRNEVELLFASVYEWLPPGGLFILTYRDLTATLGGTDRFFLVREDHNRIMTCFLEYESAEYVITHDLIHQREEGGRWRLEKSSYRKLRLAEQWISNTLQRTGFSVCVNGNAGSMKLIAGVKLCRERPIDTPVARP